MKTRHGYSVDPLKPIFKVANVNQKIGQIDVCHELSFEVYPGELLAILGKNGVGKSTLLASLAGLRRGEISGEVLVGGQGYEAWGQKSAACWRAWIPQKQQDQFSASVLETVLAGRHPHLGRWAWESTEDHDVASAALASVGMEDYAERDVQTLSGGERQRVAIATAITQNPTLYFMDEPLSHLDLHHQMDVLNLMRKKSQADKTSALMVLHEPGLAYRYCDSALLLFGDGEWLFGSVETVLTANNLSRLYGYPLLQMDTVTEQGEQSRWFVPA